MQTPAPCQWLVREAVVACCHTQLLIGPVPAFALGLRLGNEIHGDALTQSIFHLHGQLKLQIGRKQNAFFRADGLHAVDLRR